MAHTYVYRPLDASKNQLRVIEILPADDPRSPIECRLLYVSLDHDALEYEALSYTWGDKANPETILLDGQHVPVTTNLYAALRALRQPTRPRQLWIDALCINQQDVRERSHEVFRMRLIYERATRVVIWLGEAAPDSALAIRELTRLSQQHEQLVSNRITTRVLRYFKAFIDVINVTGKFILAVLLLRPVLVAFLRVFIVSILEERRWRLTSPLWIVGKTLAETAFFCFRVWVDVLVEDERKGEPDGQTVEALAGFFNRPWFGRVWVVQEVAMASYALVVVGSHVIAWDQISNAYERLHQIVSLSMCGSIYVQSRFQRLNELTNVLFRRKSPGLSGPRIRLLDLLCDLSYFQTTDDHDKVYGLLGLADDLREWELDVDTFEPSYAEAVEETYRRLAWFIIYATNRLDTLHCCIGREPKPGVPSWVPDWRDSTPRHGRQLTYDPFYLDTSRRDPEGPGFPVATLLGDQETYLKVVGFPIGRLEAGCIDLYNSQHYSPSNRFLTLILWPMNSFPIRVFGFLLKIGVVSRLIRFIRRFTRNSPVMDAILESVEITCSREVEGVQRYNYSPINLSETANAFDRKETALKMFRWAPDPWLMALHEAQDGVFLTEWCNAYTGTAKEGDFIAMLHGSPLPMLLRWNGDYSCSVVGVCSLTNMDNMLPKWCQREYDRGKLSPVDIILR
ncbi:hypothetical protein jhhlp_006994 [Lomentospora prolificans]|uniref:Heterokaryon incompatibility domain-containing protein n=1 Tax=Lomentospora prolificans TaxID=41688 RepID=A0A2N3N1D7_9PEZI|nr:hypothetical protein jhhlp_006994 [Lomentospora prolificans]